MRPSMSSLLRSTFLLAAVLLFTTTAEAQYFGRNKVQWENFDFKILRTEHFDIYYYEDEKDVVADVGRMAERWYDRLSHVFGHQFTKKPIVLYANSADFQQTTTTTGLIGEGTGGFTDAFQNRVVLPLTGSHAENDHVLGHEIVHVFQYDIARIASQGNKRFDLGQLPLWLIEGMAEYLSKGRNDPLTAMWIRDAAKNDRLPDLRKLTTDPRYFPYRYGQALMAYMGAQYGDDNVVRFFLASGTLGFQEAFPRVFGIGDKEFFAEWHAAARELYEPVFLKRPEILGEPLLGKKRTRGDLNIAPSISPDGKKTAFLSTRSLFSIDLYLADAETGRNLDRLVSSASNSHFDALRFLDSSGSWSPDSKKIAFVTFDRGDNRLAIVDVGSRKIERKLQIPGINAMANPVWSPDGRSIAFSGQTTGVSDLFVYELESGQLRRLTDDKFADLQPTFSPDGKTIAFVTDRGPGTDFEALRFNEMRIATIDIASREVRVLPLFESGKHINPQFAPDGSLYFIATPEGAPDIFRYTFGSGTITRVTRVATGVSGITGLSPALSVASGTGRLAFSLFENDDYNIYTLPASAPGEVVTPALGSGVARAALLPPLRVTSRGIATDYLLRPLEGLPTNARFETDRYDRSLHLTYLGPPTLGVGVSDNGYGGVGGSISAYFSDVLGTHNVGFTFAGGGGTTDSLDTAFGGELIYLNQENRVHWGGTASHIPYVTARTGAFRDFVTVDGQQVLADIYQQRRDIITVDEVNGLTRYPFGLTRRIEGSAGVQRYGFRTELRQQIVVGGQLIDDSTDRIGESSSLNLGRASVAFVGDSSNFGFISPVRGTRYRYELETLTGDLQFQTALADFRRYFFRRPVTLAVRSLHYGRYGTDAENTRLSDLYVGQSGLVRGYDLGSIGLSECVAPAGSNACPVFDRLVGSKIAIAGAELRVPLFGAKDFSIISGAFLPTELVGFIDAGAAWTEDEKLKVKFEQDSIERVPVFSAGIAARILLAYIPIEVYYAKPFQRPGEGWVFGFNIAPGW